MLSQVCISIIIPFYNAESYIETCIDTLVKQDFNKPFEIIMINDGSTDGGMDMIKAHDIPNIHLYSLAHNSGPGAARNLGLKMAKGKYLFFYDVDDTIDSNILTTLYDTAIKKDYDLVFCDRRYIENSKNQRNNMFSYPTDKYFENSDIVEEMRKRWYKPVYVSNIIDLSGRLIKRKIITDNKIYFEEKLRYMEDETFIWDVLGYVKNAVYIRNQLCSYFCYPNINTALSEGMNSVVNLLNFKLMKNHIQESLKRQSISDIEAKKIGDQAFIFCIISALISCSRSMLLGKLDREKGNKIRKQLIKNIVSDIDVKKSIKNYTHSKNESFLIPKLIAWRFSFPLEILCTIRAKEILRIRRKNDSL